MPYPLFESLVRQVRGPRKFLLNYSGESTVYPELVPAIRLARSTGAAVELVSVLASASESLIGELATSGLTRLTVSIHAADAEGYAAIYRHGSFETLRARLERFLELSRAAPDAPAVDFAFVAMQRNAASLEAVAAMAHSMGIRGISIFPVIRRDEIPVVFPVELTPLGTHRDSFRESLTRAVDDAHERFPEIDFTICNPHFSGAAGALGEVPSPWPGDLPAGARIHSCEQNPWETAHVLSNGDVVACEVHDRAPLGNLSEQSLEEIWHGEAYRRFRAGYESGALAECRACPWKTAYLPGPLRAEILSARGRNAQLWHGWHDSAGEPHIWASREAQAVLDPRPGSATLRVSGILPPGEGGEPNELAVFCNRTLAGHILNESPEMLAFERDFAIPADAGRPWRIAFQTRRAYVPADCGAGADRRDLGFALTLLASLRTIDTEAVERRKDAVAPLIETVHSIDRLGHFAGRHFLRPHGAGALRRFAPGLSVIIPERENLLELGACLAALREALARWNEPSEILLVVNGCDAGPYRKLRAEYPEIRWQFHPRPLSFSAAILAGLRKARHDWVYLLNSDVALALDALAAAAPHRGPHVFSIASQILLKDATRFREETNRTTLFLEDGLATIHDLIPESADTVEHFYSGGGASFFERRLLLRVLDPWAYRPFYWEDVEWGWRARKLGFHSLFCAASVAHHAQHSTIAKFYPSEEVERIVERNRFLFQLRNFTTAGKLEELALAIARSDDGVSTYFLTPAARLLIARGRLWNHRAPVPDEELLSSARSVETEARP